MSIALDGSINETPGREVPAGRDGAGADRAENGSEMLVGRCVGCADASRPDEGARVDAYRCEGWDPDALDTHGLVKGTW